VCNLGIIGTQPVEIKLLQEENTFISEFNAENFMQIRVRLINEVITAILEIC